MGRSGTRLCAVCGWRESLRRLEESTNKTEGSAKVNEIQSYYQSYGSLESQIF